LAQHPHLNKRLVWRDKKKEEFVMKKFSKLLAIALASVMVFTLVACSSNSDSGSSSSNDSSSNTSGGSTTTGGGDTGSTDTGSTGGGQKVGISMPTQSLQRWNQDGSNMKAAFEAAGFTVDLQYGGENDVQTQISQLQNMIAGGCNVLVIAAIDGGALGTVLGEAKDAGIPVIAYDRLIMNTDAVSYYATFDNWKVGTLQGKYIEDELNLSAGGGPYNIEFFTGDPGDNNINYFFGGAMEVLQPYLDSGVLVCPSGQTDILQVATIDWSPANAQSRMENLIATYNYGPNGTALAAVMCSNDSTAQGASTALQNAGFTAANFPILTGQDCDIVSVKNMIAGTQSMSVFKDTRTLANQTVDMVKAILSGGTVPVNNTTDYNNGVFNVPTFLCDPVFGDVNNYRALLIDSGYYSEGDLQ
jgi:putative multiple sugar transport system substrate-binding protein